MDRSTFNTNIVNLQVVPRKVTMTKQDLNKYIEEIYYGFDSSHFTLEMLSDQEYSKLVRLFLEYSGTSITECLQGDDNAKDNDFNTALYNMLTYDNDDTRSHFNFISIRNINSYIKKTCLQEFIDDVCAYKVQCGYEEHGYYPRHDENNGENYYSQY